MTRWWSFVIVYCLWEDEPCFLDCNDLMMQETKDASVPDPGRSIITSVRTGSLHFPTLKSRPILLVRSSHTRTIPSPMIAEKDDYPAKSPDPRPPNVLTPIPHRRNVRRGYVWYDDIWGEMVDGAGLANGRNRSWSRS